jgi:hypothetical protein
MKTLFRNGIVLAVLLFVAPVFGQFNNLSVGVIGTNFQNINNNNRLSETKTPFSYGLILGYKVDETLSVALTGEYFKDNIENIAGTERNIRTHLSAVFTPFHTQTLIPYLSFGLVYTNRNLEYANSRQETKNLINGRLGLGLDYPVFRNISLNADLGLYTDGYNVVGWSNSLGLRYSL